MKALVATLILAGAPVLAVWLSTVKRTQTQDTCDRFKSAVERIHVKVDRLAERIG